MEEHPFAKLIGTILGLAIALGIDWGLTMGMMYGLCWCFNWTFKMPVATGFWILICIVRKVFHALSN